MTGTNIPHSVERIRTTRSWIEAYEVACEIEELPNSGSSHEVARLIAWDGDPTDAFALVESALLFSAKGAGASGDWLAAREEAAYWRDVLNLYVEAFERHAQRELRCEHDASAALNEAQTALSDEHDRRISLRAVTLDALVEESRCGRTEDVPL